MKKKVVVILTMLPAEGGKFQYSISLLEGLKSLDKNIFDIIAIYYNHIWEEHFDLNVEKIFIKKSTIARLLRKVILFFPNGLYLWRKISKYIDPLYKKIFLINPALVFSPGSYEYSFESEIPSIVPIFDLMHIYEPQFPEVSQKATLNRREYLYTNICKYSKAILADSDLGKSQIIQNYDVEPNKIFVLPYIAPKYITTVEGKDCRVKYNLPAKYFFYPAQFWMHKNHTIILKAIKLLKDRGYYINAVFVGSKKNYYNKIKDLVLELNLNEQIWVLEYVSNNELIFLYKNAIALVMPTFFGPTNIPPLEAFALGCPVLTSNVYSVPDQVGDAVLLFDPLDEVELSEKIKQLYLSEELRSDLTEKGYKHFSKWNQIHYNEIISNLMNEII